MAPDAVPPTATREVALLLGRWRSGDAAAFEQLLPLVYDELRAIARRQLGRERRGHTLQPTALVHEALLRLLGAEVSSFVDRAHFLAVAARAMRRVLVDHARRGAAARRADPRGRRSLEAVAALAAPGAAEDPAELLAVDQALERLAALDARQAQIVELRFFGGLTSEETAAALALSAATVAREWRAARAWLRRELAAEGRSSR